MGVCECVAFTKVYEKNREDSSTFTKNEKTTCCEIDKKKEANHVSIKYFFRKFRVFVFFKFQNDQFVFSGTS